MNRLRAFPFILLLLALPTLALAAFWSGQTYNPGLAAAWYPLKQGGGGATLEIDIAGASNAGKLARVNNYGMYWYNASAVNPGNAGGTGAWQQLILATNLPGGSISWPDGASSSGYTTWAGAIAYNGADAYVYGEWDGCVYSATSVSGLAASTSSWTKSAFSCFAVNNNQKSGSYGPYMSIDPQNASVAAWGTPSNGVYFTTDHGVTVTQVSTSLVPTATGGNGNLVIPDPNSSVAGGQQQGWWISSSGHGLYYLASGLASGSVTTLSGAPTTFDRAQTDYQGNLWVTDASSSAVSGNLYKCSTSSCSISSAANPPFSGVGVSANGQTIVLCFTSNNNHYGNWGIEYSTNGGSTWQGGTGSLSASDIPWLTHQQGLAISDCKIDSNGDTFAADGVGVWKIPNGSLTASGQVWTSATAGIETLDSFQITSPIGTPIISTWDRPVRAVVSGNKYPSGYGVNYTGNIILGSGNDWAGQAPLNIAAVAQAAGGGAYSTGYSTDGGATWTTCSAFPSDITGSTGENGTIAVSDANHWVWAIAGSGSMFFTANHCGSWAATSGGTAGGWAKPYYTYQNTVIADKTSTGVANNLFYAWNNSDFKIYKSLGGATWVAASASAPFSNFSDGGIIADPLATGKFLEYQGDAPTAGNFKYCTDSSPTTNSGVTVTCATIVGVSANSAAGFGAPCASHSNSAVYFYGTVSGTLGAYQSCDASTSPGSATFTSLGQYPLGYIDQVVSVTGDNNVAGRMELCFKIAGCAVYPSPP